ncbi:hypothetical protein BHM03_00022100, partial [Ensete ventricosum]
GRHGLTTIERDLHFLRRRGCVLRSAPPGDIFPWLQWIHALDGFRARVERVFGELDDIYSQVIEEHLRGDRTSEHADLVQVLLRLREDPTQRNTFGSMDHVKGLLTSCFYRNRRSSQSRLSCDRSSTSFTAEIHYCSSGNCYLLVIGRSVFFLTTIDLLFSAELQSDICFIDKKAQPCHTVDSPAAACFAPLVASAALLDDYCLCAHGLFWTLQLSLRVQSCELVGPSEDPELTTAAFCYLYSDDNLELLDAVLKLPVFIPLSKSASIIRCVEPSPSVSESLDLILDGAQNLVALIGSVGRKMLAVADFYCSFLTIFTADTETSAATIIWTMTKLLRNPRVMARAQKEVRDAVGKKDAVEETDLHDLPFLKQVINESLRLHPPAPLLLPRETTEACAFGGYEITAGTRVFVNAKAIGTDPGSWSNPQEFRPERFSSGGGGYVRWGECFGFVPFGGGWRICPGINFGLAVVELVLANLLYCFDWEARLVKGEELDVEEEAFGFAVHRKRPLLSGGQRLFFSLKSYFIPRIAILVRTNIPWRRSKSTVTARQQPATVEIDRYRLISRGNGRKQPLPGGIARQQAVHVPFSWRIDTYRPLKIITMFVDGEEGDARRKAYVEADAARARAVEGKGAGEVGGEISDGGKVGAEEDPAAAEAVLPLGLGEQAAVVLELHANPHRRRHEGGQSAGVAQDVFFKVLGKGEKRSCPSSRLFLCRNETDGVGVSMTSVCVHARSRPDKMTELSQKRRTD